MKKILPALLLLSSCAHVEVVHLAPEFKCQSTSAYTYENDSVRIAYNFWDEQGVMSYRFENKTDVPLYVDWSKSSFIRDGEKFAYYTDETQTRTRSGGINGYDAWGFRHSSAVSAGRAVHAERVTFVPPHSSIDKQFAPLVSYPYLKIDDAVLKPAADKHVSCITMTKEVSSPRFRNYITYASNEAFEHPQYADNAFYADSIAVMTKDRFFRKERKSPTQFYLVHQAQQIGLK